MDLKLQIEKYEPKTKEEQTAKEAILSSVRMYGDKVLEREQEDAHITVSALILNREMTRSLMVFHNIYHAFTWVGGHADGDTDLLAAVCREAKEETGVDEIEPLSAAVLSLDLLPVPAHTKNGKHVKAHIHYSVAYGLLASEHQNTAVKRDENSAVEWIDTAQWKEICREPHMVPIYDKLLFRMREINIQKQKQYGRLPIPLIQWYQKHARTLPWREDKEPYHVWLSEIMLQQTRVEAVRAYYVRFLSQLPTIKDLAEADEERLFKLWEGLGYYNRARNLQKAAQQIVEKYNGVFPEKYTEILALPGIGEYTAGAVASICFGQPVPAVDGNVLRVISRITEQYANIDKPAVKKQITAQLAAQYPKENCGDFTQSLMELGATVCLPNGMPKCDICPVSAFCMAYQNGVWQELPVRMKKKPRRIEEHTVFILSMGDRIAVQKRKKSGLLRGLWEFPNIEGVKTAQEAAEIVAQWCEAPVLVREKAQCRHVFTHVEWHMTCYYIECPLACEPFTWVTQTELSEEVTLPTAFRICLKNSLK